MIDQIIALSQIEITAEMSEKEKIRAEKKNAYYENALREMHDGKWISWNWAATLLFPFWMMYRKIYAGTLISIFLFIVIKMTIDIPYINLQTSILLGLFGNKMYYEHLKRKAVKGYTPEIYHVNNSDVIFCPLVAAFFCSGLWPALSTTFLHVENKILMNIILDIPFYITAIIVMLCDYVKTRNALRNSMAVDATEITTQGYK
jgi:hypothetical protein